MTPRRRASSHRRESGQSLVETAIVGVFVLVPVFLLVPLLGKYIDLQSATLQAARNAAFERTVWSDSGRRNDTQVAQESNHALAQRVTSRFFGPLDQPIQSTGSHSYSPRALWVGTAGNSLVPAARDIQVTLSQSASPDAPDQLLKPALRLESVLSQGGPLRALNFKGLFSATASVTPRAITYPFLQAVDPTFRAHDTLLADGWGASRDKGSSSDVKAQIQASLPRGLGVFRDSMAPFQLTLQDLRGLHLENVLTDNPQEVPQDHLQAYHG